MNKQDFTALLTAILMAGNTAGDETYIKAKIRKAKLILKLTETDPELNGSSSGEGKTIEL